MSEYDQMAKVINYLNSHFTEQPSLTDLAAVAGLSTTHFQRKFKSWTGVSPKSFVQSLTFQRARECLASGSGTLDTSFLVGLSGSGRLHDLCVKLVAATPGEIKTGGAGLEIIYGYGDSPFGQCFIASTERGVVSVDFIYKDRITPLSGVKASWPNARFKMDNKISRDLLNTVFHPVQPRVQTVSAYVRGSEFQLKVWQALLKVPYGSSISYGGLAKKINHNGAARAVGTAVAVNSLAYLIPCHRVIRETGVTGQYRWGEARKKFILAYEIQQLNSMV